MDELKDIRERLLEAVDSNDWWVVKSQINKIDTILHRLQLEKATEKYPNFTVFYKDKEDSFNEEKSRLRNYCFTVKTIYNDILYQENYETNSLELTVKTFNDIVSSLKQIIRSKINPIV